MDADSKKIVNLNLKRDRKILDFSDFQKQNIKFDILRLQEAYRQITTTKKFDDGGGISHFGAICLTRKPGDPDSVKGSKARGIYWTKPDKSGAEVSRDININESEYSEFIPDYENTYFKEVFDVLSSKYKLGRVRILLKEPRSTLSWHRDPEPRLHIPIVTNPGCLMVIDNVAKHMPADGSVWITNNTKYHNAFNGGEENRVHLVACVLDYKFN
tara:strand:- start:333 stop:974 length:642 start_codon:yes stop_codon:yes gene_type:complete